MKEKYVGIFWGAVLVVLGAIALLTGARSFSITDPKLALAIFAPVAALFFASYFLSGKQKWGWLVPACIFTALGVMMIIMIITDGVAGPVVAAPIFLGVAAPFFVAYFLDRSRWWALIPGYIMVVMAILISVTEQIGGELFATFFMIAAAMPFLAIYLLDRSRRWALIPFVAIAIVGVIPLLSTRLQGETLGGVINLLIGVPFLVVYFWKPRNWWALIPGGFFITVAIGVILSGSALTGGLALNEAEAAGRVVGGVIFLGWALTFFLLWLRRASAPTAWAVYPAAALALFALIASFAGNQGLTYTWPVILIAAGGLMIYNSWMKKRV